MKKVLKICFNSISIVSGILGTGICIAVLNWNRHVPVPESIKTLPGTDVMK
jgi:hypothetical protein